MISSNRSANIRFILILLLLSDLTFSRGKPWEFGEIKRKGENLVFDFKAGDLVNDQIMRGLRRGMTAAIEYQVQLWKHNARWMDEMVHERLVRLKVNYDNWEKKYVVYLGKDKPHWLPEDRVRKRCSHLTDFPVAPAEDMRSDAQYYIKIRVLLKPMSIESYQEIKQWLAGEVKDLDTKSISKTKKPGKKARNWFLGLILNLTGFGDRVISAKSSVFTWKDGNVKHEEGAGL